MNDRANCDAVFKFKGSVSHCRQQAAFPTGYLIACKIEEVQSAGGERGGSGQPEATLEIFRFAFDFIFAASLIYARVYVCVCV